MTDYANTTAVGSDPETSNVALSELMPANDEPLPSVSRHVVFRRVDHGAVLLSMADEVYFGLNPVGARVWELLPPTCTTLAELCARLVEEYSDAEPAAVRADVQDLLSELVQQGLVIRPTGETRPA